MLSLTDLQRLAEAHPEALEAEVAGFDIGGRPFDFDRSPAIMGVVNMSRDSWYRESVVPDVEAAIRRGRVLAAQGAALVDVGAQRLDHRNQLLDLAGGPDAVGVEDRRLG
ncbi:MAG: dihydropteroate synthase, partial [Solirubrobacterales bacterium]